MKQKLENMKKKKKKIPEKIQTQRTLYVFMYFIL